MAGDRDQTAPYEGVRFIFANAVNCDRYLLVHQRGDHEVAVNPAPPVTFTRWREYTHYAEPALDNTRTNNVNQHFLTAFLGVHLKGAAYKDYLDSTYPDANDSNTKASHPGGIWKGFKEWSAVGLRCTACGRSRLTALILAPARVQPTGNPARTSVGSSIGRRHPGQMTQMRTAQGAARAVPPADAQTLSRLLNCSCMLLSQDAVLRAQRPTGRLHVMTLVALRDLVGLQAFSEDGTKIGKVKDVITDRDAAAEYLVIGRFLTQLVVPAEVANSPGECVVVRFSSSFLDMAPSIRAKGTILPEVPAG